MFKALNKFYKFLVSSEIDKPKYCCWVLTYECDFRCRMCRIWNIDPKIEEYPSLGVKKEFVNTVAEYVDPDFEFHISGGEPLISDEIIPLVRHIAKTGLRTNLVTNGWHLTEGLMAALSGAGLNSLTFSVDGFTPEVHDHLRGRRGSFERIEKMIDLIERKGCDTEISLITLINGYNIDEIIPLVDMVEKRPVIKMISFQAVTQPFSDERNDKWYESGKDSSLWPTDQGKVRELMRELRNRRLNGGKIGNHPNHFRSFEKYFNDPNKFIKKVRCRMGDYEFHIDPFGKLFFCMNTPEFGDIREWNLADAWNSARAASIRENIRKCRKNCHILVNCFYEDE